MFNLLESLYHCHPVRKDIAGTVESIAKITPEYLYRCYRTFYNLHNMVQMCIRDRRWGDLARSGPVDEASDVRSAVQGGGF